MALIEFKNLPDTSTPLNAENLNHNFNELDKRITESRDWVQLNTDSVPLTALGETTTINLNDDWTNYKEILILVGQTLLECSNVVIYPNTTKKAETYNLAGLSTYQFYSYVGVGQNTWDFSDTRKCFCYPREIIGYDITSMHIIAVYGRK